MDNETIEIRGEAEGTVFTNCNPKNLYVKAEEWDALIGQFSNGDKVRITIEKIS